MISFKPCDLPVITGDKVTLRPITDADTDLIVRWRNDPAVQQFFIFREPFSVGKLIAFMFIWAALVVYTATMFRGKKA